MADAIKIHEAAHFGVASHFGCNVSMIRTSPDDGECRCNLDMLDDHQKGLTLAAGAAAVEYFGLEVHGTSSDDDKLRELLGEDSKRIRRIRDEARSLVARLQNEILAMAAELDKQPTLYAQDLARICHSNTALAAFKYLYDAPTKVSRLAEPSLHTLERGVPAGFARVGGHPIV